MSTHSPVTAHPRRNGPSAQRRRLFAAAVAAVLAIDVWWARHLVLAGHDSAAQAVGVVSFVVVLVLTVAGVRAGLISILITRAGFIGTALLTAHIESTALSTVGTRTTATIIREGVCSDGRNTTFFYTLKSVGGSAIATGSSSTTS